ncbi:MAG: hypothetical protein RMJ56_16670 [Gemmataceae bacterium]|nr:hypothetical protein [Gemmata sp.]MDW8199232.1 hypothetical protein [Gemmataceae bacterium]
MSHLVASAEFTDLIAAVQFVKRTRWELRELWMVRVFLDRYQLIDVNKDYFELRGIGYRDADIVPLLRLVNAAFDPATLHEPTDQEYKEFLTGRRWAWAHDRVM